MRRPLRILISAGPTREPIDPVRFLSNYSTGYLGSRLAAEALRRGHRTTVVSGPTEEAFPARARVIPVVRAQEMERAMRRHAAGADVIIMAAAVSDFQPARAAATKLRRRAATTLTLKATPDIIGRLPRRPGQLVVGFALETERVVARALRKLRAKRLDLLLAQRIRPGSALRPERSRGTQHANGAGMPAPRRQAGQAGSPFGRRAVQAWLIGRGGSVRPLGRLSKPAVARALLDKIEALWYGEPRSTHDP